MKNHFNGAEFIKESNPLYDTINEKILMNLFNTRDQMNNFEKSIRRSWAPVSKKVIKPSKEEIESNSRSRSAKLRIAEKN